eukprot:scaffold93344_cov21-Tisochrysis_lutea.AAC.1
MLPCTPYNSEVESIKQVLFAMIAPRFPERLGLIRRKVQNLASKVQATIQAFAYFRNQLW